MGGSSPRLLAAIVLSSALLAGNAAIAAAKDTKPKLGFFVPATNGYRVYVSGDSAKRVSILAFRSDGPGSFDSAYYSTRGVVTAKGMRASFGTLGEVRMRFRPSGRLRRGNHDCLFNQNGVVRNGAFRGSVSFRGEGGYTMASSTRARAKPSPVPPEPCSVFGKKGLLTYLSAFTSDRNTLVVAYKRSSGPIALLQGALNEKANGVRVARFIQALVPGSVFTLSGPLMNNADITGPPLPFSGSAHLENYVSPPAPSKGKWSGSLTGAFVGQGSVALAGPQFNVGLGNTSP